MIEKSQKGAVIEKSQKCAAIEKSQKCAVTEKSQKCVVIEKSQKGVVIEALRQDAQLHTTQLHAIHPTTSCDIQNYKTGCVFSDLEETSSKTRSCGIRLYSSVLVLIYCVCKLPSIRAINGMGCGGVCGV